MVASTASLHTEAPRKSPPGQTLVSSVLITAAKCDILRASGFSMSEGRISEG